ncbi:MAG: hypothetical protein KIS63_06320 [Caldilineales bacterium]|nr:hypothetical protein [Caldilineales bacterium]
MDRLIVAVYDRPNKKLMLLLQHFEDTGQIFTPDALRLAYDLTQGQPWLVNALARQAVQVVAPEPAQSVDVAVIAQAKGLLIQHRDAQFGNLIERLHEERVRQVIEPLLAGRALAGIAIEHFHFALDLGLVRRNPAGGLMFANPIYREIMAQELTCQ